MERSFFFSFWFFLTANAAMTTFCTFASTLAYCIVVYITEESERAHMRSVLQSSTCGVTLSKLSCCISQLVLQRGIHWPAGVNDALQTLSWMNESTF